MLARLPQWSDRTVARYLVGWWLGSIALLDYLMVQYLFPVDTQWHWLSAQALEIVMFAALTWLVPGLVLGGWKALLVATGVSGVRTGTDKALMVLFSLWIVGWPIVVVISAVQQGVL